MTLLATDLKEGTKVLHAEAGRSKFMKQFFKGEVSLATYGRFLISLYHVYRTLEKALDQHKENPQLSLIYFPKELYRVDALEQDIEFFNGPDWREMLTPISPAQQAYISAIERCASSDTPELLVAHSYVRYLGDLSGGQVLAKRLQKFNDLPENQGIAFYQFDWIEDPDTFKEMYRKRLNQIEVSEELQQQLVEEAKGTFLRNIEMFREFDDDFQVTAMTVQEQTEFLAALEPARVKLAVEERARKQGIANQHQHQQSSFPSSWHPSVLWNSLAHAVGLSYKNVNP
ncbi:heme oxygenase (decycling) 1 [Modicella reniformis]|uniref:heme oxygenase (biliverdin-producing) n=1 Tax=Modicella reniformis TaxID=1440133 RepID=A0A9P6J7E6_9FUNG|nr:heme oxygenase (decycling) 1 [Modicella reniformis]